MINFYLSCKFCTLTINLSELVLPDHIPLLIIVFGKESLRNVLNAFQRRVNKNNFLENVLKTSWRCLGDVFQDVLKMSWRHLGKTSPGQLEDVLKKSWRRLEDGMSKTNILVLTKTSWRRLKGVFWRRKTKANIFVLKRRLHQDECLLGRLILSLINFLWISKNAKTKLFGWKLGWKVRMRVTGAQPGIFWDRTGFLE